MTGMIRRRLLGVVLAAGACTPFDESPTTSTGEDGGSADAGADASSLPSPRDAGESRDAGDGGTGAGSPCAGKHVVCEDFDGEWSGWQTVTHSSSPLNADTTRFVSPPRSLSVEVNAKVNENHPSFLSRPFPAAQRFSLSADVRAELTGAPDSEVDLLGLELAPPTGIPTEIRRYYVAIIARSDGNFHLEVKIEAPVQPVDMSVELAPIPADFTRISLDLDLAAGTIVGAAGPVQQARPVTTASSMSGTLVVGAAWAANSRGTYAINVDNVVLD